MEKAAPKGGPNPKVLALTEAHKPLVDNHAVTN
jgi:hypothetical protein